MKKIIVILCMLLMLYGCQNKAEIIELGQTYTISNQVCMEIIKEEAIHKIEPSNKNIISQSLEAKDNYIYIDVLLKTVNLTEEQLKLEQIFNGRYEVNKISYDLNVIMETTNYTGLTTTDSLKHEEERYVHLYCEIPQDEMKQGITLYLQILNQENFQYTFSIKEETKIQNAKQSVGDVLSLKQSQITINQLGQSKKIEPSNKGLFYSYIPVDNEDETFVYLQVDIHNISNQTIDPKEYIYGEYHINDESIHSQIIMETKNHKSLEKNGKIEAAQTSIIYLVMPVKDSILEKEGYIEVFVEGKTFQIQESDL